MDAYVSLQGAMVLGVVGLLAGLLGVALLIAALFGFRAARRPPTGATAPMARVAPPPPPTPTPPAAPPSVAAPPPAQPAKKGGWGCGRLLACGCLVVVLLLVGGGAAGYVAYQNDLITPDTVLTLIGQGPADIEFDNFRDETVYVGINQLDAPADSSPVSASLEIAAFDVRQYHVGTPGRYRVDFGTTSGGADLGICNLTVQSGDQYQFVPMPEMIVVNRANRTSDVGTDYVLETSSLCR